MNDRSSKGTPLSGFNDRDIPLSLANEAQYLLLCQSSVSELYSTVFRRTLVSGNDIRLDKNDFIDRFRANFVVSGEYDQPSLTGHSPCEPPPSLPPSLPPYSEDKWERVNIGNAEFFVS